MEIHGVSYERYGELEKITLRKTGREIKQNCFTVINGANGTGKSAILRIISDAALGLDVSRQSNLFTRDIKISISGEISRTIALSGTHNDRFPMNSGIELRQKSNRFDLLPFYYYGPKQHGNYTSVFKASNTIAHSLLSEIQNPLIPEALISFLDYLGFEPRVSLILQMGNRFKGGTSPDYFKLLRQSLDKLKENISGRTKISDTIYDSISRAEDIVDSSVLRKLFLINQTGKRLVFDFEFGRIGLAIYNDDFFDFIRSDTIYSLPQLIADLIALGVISAKVSLFRKGSSAEIPLEELSSGEWQLIYSLLNLAINVADNSLVLVDEPENSLHPQWQTKYVSLIKNLVSHCVGCHVIIATHSPLIAASIMPEDGNLVRLERRRSTGDLHAEMEDTAYGWLPEDVLREKFDMDSVRPPEMTQVIDRALQLLKYSSEPSSELKDAAMKIAVFRKDLPQHDPLLSVLNAIVEIAFGAEPDHT